jgi:hypothetical protein
VLQWIKKQSLNIRFVKNKTPEICIEAVKQNRLAAEFISEDDLSFS